MVVELQKPFLGEEIFEINPIIHQQFHKRDSIQNQGRLHYLKQHTWLKDIQSNDIKISQNLKRCMHG